jgi:hypothetical protein
MNELTPNNLPADRFAAMRQKAATAIEIWQPVPGECLVGVLVGSQKASGTYGENYQAIVQAEDGSLHSFWLTAWLRDNLKAQGATTGDMLAVTFLGKRQSPAGKFYNAYSLIVDKGLAEIKGEPQ